MWDSLPVVLHQALLHKDGDNILSSGVHKVLDLTPSPFLKPHPLIPPGFYFHCWVSHFFLYCSLQI